MRNLFSTRIKVILVIAALLTIGLSILSGVTNTTMADLAVQGVLAPIRGAATTLTRTAEKYYGYMFRYEALAAENAELKAEMLERFCNRQALIADPLPMKSMPW